MEPYVRLWGVETPSEMVCCRPFRHDPPWLFCREPVTYVQASAKGPRAVSLSGFELPASGQWRLQRRGRTANLGPGGVSNEIRHLADIQAWGPI